MRDKKPRGFVLTVRTREGSEKSTGYSSFVEALYQARRYGKVIAVYMDIRIHDKLLYTYNGTTKEEVTYMTTFAEFRSEHKDLNTIPSMDATDRKLFQRSGIPFFITAVRDGVTTSNGDNVLCDIKVDTSSPEYQAAMQAFQVGTNYVLWFKDTPARREQMDKLVKPHMENNGRFVLVEFGKSHDLDIYIPKQSLLTMSKEKPPVSVVTPSNGDLTPIVSYDMI